MRTAVIAVKRISHIAHCGEGNIRVLCELRAFFNGFHTSERASGRNEPLSVRVAENYPHSGQHSGSAVVGAGASEGQDNMLRTVPDGVFYQFSQSGSCRLFRIHPPVNQRKPGAGCRFYDSLVHLRE